MTRLPTTHQTTMTMSRGHRERLKQPANQSVVHKLLHGLRGTAVYWFGIRVPSRRVGRDAAESCDSLSRSSHAPLQSSLRFSIIYIRCCD